MNDKNEDVGKTVFQIAHRAYLVSTVAIISLLFLIAGIMLDWDTTLYEVVPIIIVIVPVSGLVSLQISMVGGGFGSNRIGMQRTIKDFLLTTIVLTPLIYLYLGGLDIFDSLLDRLSLSIIYAFIMALASLLFNLVGKADGIIQNEDLRATQVGVIIGSVIGAIFTLWITALAVYAAVLQM